MRTGLASHGTTVALTPARAVTSHARKRFHQRYRGKFKYARLVFAFDLGLLAIAFGLLAANLSFYLSPVAVPSGLSLVMQSRELVAGDILPIEATIRAADQGTHEAVRLSWILPAWVEVVSAEPPLTPGNVALLGRVTPIREAISRISVRIRATPGTAVPFTFRLEQGVGSSNHIFTGSDTRKVASSALTVEPVVPVQDVASGGTIPLLVTNRGRIAAPAVIVRLMTKDNALQTTLGENGEATIGAMQPGERRVIFLHMDPMPTGRADMVLETQDASRSLYVTHLNPNFVAAPGVTITSMQSLPGADVADVAYQATQPGSIVVVHAGMKMVDAPVHVFPVSVGTGHIRIPLDPTRVFSEITWSAIPAEERNGSLVLGSQSVGALSSHLPFAAAARYYAAGGDQLGVGPIPPRVGVATSYWVIWSVGPTASTLRDLTLQAQLGPGVIATGKHAAAADGEFVPSGSDVVWHVPLLPATGADPATFAFEVLLTPTGDDRGHVPVLIQQSTATAVDASTSSTVSGVVESQDTNLPSDTKAGGNGKVE